MLGDLSFFKPIFFAALTLVMARYTSFSPAARPPTPIPATEIVRIHLVNQNAAGLTQLVHDIAGVYAAAQDQTNTLIIKGSHDDVVVAEDLARHLDQTQGPEFDSDMLFVYRVKNSHAEKLAAAFQALASHGVFHFTDPADPRESAPFVMVAEPEANALLVNVNRRYESQVRSLIEQLDQLTTTAPASPNP